MSSITSTVTIRHLRNIFAQHGLQETIVTDNGTSFVSEEFKQFLEENGISHIWSSPYHPATNGLAENAVQIFKQGLKKHHSGNLQDRISKFLFHYRLTPHSTTGLSPAELLCGRKSDPGWTCSFPTSATESKESKSCKNYIMIMGQNIANLRREKLCSSKIWDWRTLDTRIHSETIWSNLLSCAARGKGHYLEVPC